jgi:hypothetical protein
MKNLCDCPLWEHLARDEYAQGFDSGKFLEVVQGIYEYHRDPNTWRSERWGDPKDSESLAAYLLAHPALEFAARACAQRIKDGTCTPRPESDGYKR